MVQIRQHLNVILIIIFVISPACIGRTGPGTGRSGRPVGIEDVKGPQNVREHDLAEFSTDLILEENANYALLDEQYWTCVPPEAGVFYPALSDYEISYFCPSNVDESMEVEISYVARSGERKFESSLNIIVEPTPEPDGWIYQCSGAEKVSTHDIVGDYKGNIFTVGIFKGTLRFGDGETNLISSSGDYNNCFLIKNDSDGQLMWVRTWKGPSDLKNLKSTKVSIGKDGNVYVMGLFADKPDPMYASSQTDYYDGLALNDTYIKSYSSEGDEQWTVTLNSDLRRTQGIFYQFNPYDMAVDSIGNVWLSGSFMDTGEGLITDLDPGENDVTYPEYPDQTGIILVNYSRQGEYIRHIFVEVVEIPHQFDALLEYKDDQLFLCGEFSGDIFFNKGTGDEVHLNCEGLGRFLTCMNTDGYARWVKNLNFYVSDFSLDSNGNIYCTGVYEEEVDFKGNADEFTQNALSWDHAMLLKLDSLGEYEWVRKWGADVHDYGLEVIVDNSDRIFCAGHFSGDVDFGDSVQELHSATREYGGGAFVSCYDSGGIRLWTQSWSNMKITDSFGMAVSNDDSLFLSSDLFGWEDDRWENSPEDNLLRRSYAFPVDLNPLEGKHYVLPNIEDPNAGADSIFIMKFPNDGTWAAE